MINNLKENRKKVLEDFKTNKLNPKQLRTVSGGRRYALASCHTGSSLGCDNTANCQCPPQV